VGLPSGQIWLVTDQAPASGIGDHAAALFRLLRSTVGGLRLANLHYFDAAGLPGEAALPGVRRTGPFLLAPLTLSGNQRRFAEATRSTAAGWHLLGTHYGLAGRGPPTIATLHDYYRRKAGPEVIGDGRRLLIEAYTAGHNRFVGRALRRCAEVVTISETTRSSVAERLGIQSRKIHFWVETDRFSPGDAEEARRSLGLPVRGTYILNVGSGSLNKNRRLLEAVARHLPPEITILKAGAPPLVPHPRILSLGVVPDDSYTRLFQAADLYLHTSTYEGFGRPLLEAAGCGLPIVSTDAPAAPEILGDAAEYVPSPYTPEATLAAIQAALEPGRYEELRHRVLRLRERFAPAVARAAYESLYRDVWGS
jgi:glycosyltransferase involved in cell wall biosynthesis